VSVSLAKKKLGATDPLAKKKPAAEVSGIDDLKYVISRDVTGLQNRKKLLRASLSGLDWKKEFVKAPRARLSEYRHQSTERLVGRVEREREDVRAYMTESLGVLGDALEDKYYLMACEPGVRDKDSVNASKKNMVNDFRASLFETLGGGADYGFGLEPGDVAGMFASSGNSNAYTPPPTEPKFHGNPYQREAEPTGRTLNDDDTCSVTSAELMAELESQRAPAQEGAEAGTGTGSGGGGAVPCPFLEGEGEPLPAGAGWEALGLGPGPAPADSADTRGTTRAGTVGLPKELPFPSEKVDYRQVNVPPPYYRKTFGILGERKDIGASPATLQLLSKTASKTSIPEAATSFKK
jgi:hypothetical protein